MGLTKRRLILVGMMGSGKTTVGRLVAEATGWPYIDNDDVLEQLSGRSARELAAHGEAAVRSAEATALKASLATPPPCIVGVAAGAILDRNNRAAIVRGGLTVWLRARPATLAARLSDDVARPWLGNDPLAWMTAASRDREPLYKSVAGVVIDVDDLAAHEIAAAIVATAAAKALLAET